MKMPPKTRDDFEIAIICALPLEADAVEALFDEYYDASGDKYGKLPGDGNTYTTGRMGQHDIVLVHMPEMGKGSAATVASRAHMSFVGIKLALVVGICGGVPFQFGNNQQTEMILGDVFISNGVLEYDFSAQYPDGFNRKSDVKDTLGRPNRDIRGSLAKLETSRTRKQLELKLSEYVHRDLQLSSDRTSAKYPGVKQDILYESSYRHKHRNSPGRACTSNKSSQHSVCLKALKEDCEVLGCGPSEDMRRRT
jgi:nucleoside phosphorylase